MSINKEAYHDLIQFLTPKNVALVAVSKTKPVSEIRELYDLGHRDFGENYVQEMLEKAAQLPNDIHWHFIGHLQSNKVKQLASHIHLVHAVDSFKLLKVISSHGEKIGRVIDVLLQVHIATEETKFGLDEAELNELINHPELPTIKFARIRGLMGMASFSSNKDLVRKEFKYLKNHFDQLFAKFSGSAQQPPILSMGMSSDYQIALEEGTNMVRIGSLVFGER